MKKKGTGWFAKRLPVKPHLRGSAVVRENTDH
jgi:hypothetical protein